MSLRIAVQMDHVSTSTSPATRVSRCRLEAQRRGHKLFHYTPDRLIAAGQQGPCARRGNAVRDEKGNHFTLGEPVRTDLSEMDVVLLRQDPPFDMNYITTTHILERIHPKTLVVNDPAWVRNSPEKIFVTEFADLMPETLITKDPREVARLPRGVRRHHHQAALRQWRRRHIPSARGRHAILPRCSKCSARCSASPSSCSAI